MNILALGDRERHRPVATASSGTVCQSVKTSHTVFAGDLVSVTRAFETLVELAAERYVDATVWAWAYLGLGDYEEALRLLNAASENLENTRDPYPAHFIRWNVWSDSMLEEPEWVEVRERLRAR